MNAKKTVKKAAPAKAEAAHRAALTRVEEEDERRRIRALLRLPMHQRTHFLRVRIGAGSAL